MNFGGWFSLPQSILTEVWFTWLNSVSVVCTDGAVLSRADRPSWLCILGDKSPTFELKRWLKGYLFSGFAQWCLRRGIHRIGVIMLFGDPVCAPADLLSSIGRYGDDFSEIHIDADKKPLSALQTIGKNARNLTKLSIERCHKDDNGLGILLSLLCQQIQDLRLHGCSRACLTNTSFPNLVSLTVDCSLDHAAAAMMLSTCKHLKSFKYLNCGVADEVFVSLARNQPNVECLSLAMDCSESPTSTVVTECLTSLTQLRIFFLTDYGVALEDACISAIVANCKHLYAIRIEYFYSVTDVSMRAIAKHCANTLTHFAIRDCSGTLDGVLSVVQACRNLVDLAIEAVTRTVHTELRDVLQASPPLQSLSLDDVLMSNADLAMLVPICHELKYLRIIPLSGVDLRNLADVALAARKLRTLSVMETCTTIPPSIRNFWKLVQPARTGGCGL